MWIPLGSQLLSSNSNWLLKLFPQDWLCKGHCSLHLSSLITDTTLDKPWTTSNWKLMVTLTESLLTQILLPDNWPQVGHVRRQEWRRSIKVICYQWELTGKGLLWSGALTPSVTTQRTTSETPHVLQLHLPAGVRNSRWYLWGKVGWVSKSFLPCSKCWYLLCKCNIAIKYLALI